MPFRNFNVHVQISLCFQCFKNLTHSCVAGCNEPCDEIKYDVVDRVVARFQDMKAKGETVAGQSITDLITVNGVRVVSEDGTWSLVRASSNKPELVVVVESPVSEDRLHAMFKAVDGVLRENSEVGDYNQTL